MASDQVYTICTGLADPVPRSNMALHKGEVAKSLSDKTSNDLQISYRLYMCCKEMDNYVTCVQIKIAFAAHLLSLIRDFTDYLQSHLIPRNISDEDPG